MIKRTIFFGNAAYLSTRNEQLIVNFPEKAKEAATIPIEDIGFLVLEDPQITITNRLIEKLIAAKAAIVTCDQRHMPCSLLQPLVGHSEQTQRYRSQINMSAPLKKQLWQQTVISKIQNQGDLLKRRGLDPKRLIRYAKQVNSGDLNNQEALAAAYYFQKIIDIPEFSRNQKDIPPNNLFNYGYAILRAVAARAIISSGLLPSVGIFHHSKYDAYCLADDVMEPYRPFVDEVVIEIVDSEIAIEELTTSLKKELLKIPALDVEIDGTSSPLMTAMSRTTSSLYDCIEGVRRKILYPKFINF